MNSQVPDNKILSLLRLMLNPSAAEGEIRNSTLALRRLVGASDDCLAVLRNALMPKEPIAVRDDCVMPFGQYVGLPLSKIARTDSAYLRWCLLSLRRLQPRLREQISKALREAA